MGFRKDFVWTDDWEIHAARRREMLEKYGPQIKQLYGSNVWTAVEVAFVVSVAIGLAWISREWDLLKLTALGYFAGAFCNHNLFLAVHELSHNLAFQKPVYNKLTMILANLPIGIPFAMKFQKYHRDHHTGLGVDGIDMDVPSKTEGDVVTNRALKLVWVLLQLAFYAFRPVILNPLPLTGWDVVNIIACVTFDAAVFWLMGWKALFYLVASSFLGGGLHPMAGHFIAEHYTFDPRQETYSYYGPLNLITYCVGYHNEHHDFPRIPWTRLHKLHEIAPEYYDSLHHHTSWSRVIFDYVASSMGPFCRMKRLPSTKPAAFDGPKKAQ
uniref:Sphingolipid delta(4)-desaturase DES1-like n=1 Tax=Tetraselmis sp. GSL018 TaxID=582737 RepID=A0A061R2W2_9CHLO|mmetsp:Transcript_8718/g.21035  ORF Transcript_8718/g.21035 Transcript_8718/m.21035 type:complete len:326 (+) Transcript_8718:105-1082(+)